MAASVIGLPCKEEAGRERSGGGSAARALTLSGALHLPLALCDRWPRQEQLQGVLRKPTSSAGCRRLRVRALSGLPRAPETPALLHCRSGQLSA